MKSSAATYAALIMEELDPDGLGYIEVLSDVFFNIEISNVGGILNLEEQMT